MLAQRGADRRGRVGGTGLDLELDEPRDLLLLGRHVLSLRVLVRVFSRPVRTFRMEAYRTTITGIHARPKTEQVRTGESARSDLFGSV
ncbi:hypothetical protein GCM10010129_17600 [Streptomyces fumigatiscleroticus]|nr:hypothetical protein GCM10010129_17600 [Streptomyces fumigatiscleroticus]